jgi:hypothetical protein
MVLGLGFLIKCWSKVLKNVIRVQNTHCHLSRNTGCYICGATFDLGERPGYHDMWLRLARPKVPSVATPRQGPPGELQCDASNPTPPETCRSSRVGGSTLLDGQDMLRSSPSWEADCPDAPSPR